MMTVGRRRLRGDFHGLSFVALRSNHTSERIYWCDGA
jgi:hypothetical protein